MFEAAATASLVNKSLRSVRLEHRHFATGVGFAISVRMVAETQAAAIDPRSLGH
jgi:hypothetical protein